MKVKFNVRKTTKKEKIEGIVGVLLLIGIVLLYRYFA